MATDCTACFAELLRGYVPFPVQLGQRYKRLGRDVLYEPFDKLRVNGRGEQTNRFSTQQKN
jgi:hypothetical protein